MRAEKHEHSLLHKFELGTKVHRCNEKTAVAHLIGGVLLPRWNSRAGAGASATYLILAG